MNIYERTKNSVSDTGYRWVNTPDGGRAWANPTLSKQTPTTSYNPVTGADSTGDTVGYRGTQTNTNYPPTNNTNTTNTNYQYNPITGADQYGDTVGYRQMPTLPSATTTNYPTATNTNATTLAGIPPQNYTGDVVGGTTPGATGTGTYPNTSAGYTQSPTGSSSAGQTFKVANGTEFTLLGYNPDGTVNVRRADGEVFNNISRDIAQKYGTSDQDLASLFNRSQMVTPGVALPGTTYTAENVQRTAATGAPTQANYAPANVPTFANTLQDMYVDTFRNPQTFYDEYMAGQGNALVESTARAMAKSGRTGLLPTLQTQAYQDYMTNYLPSVRKDLLGGTQDETSRNQLLNQMYGQQLDFDASLYGSDVSRYGQELGLEGQKLQVQQSAASDAVKREIALLENDAKLYGYNEQTIQQLYQTMGMAFPHMSNAEQLAFTAALKAEMTNADTSGDLAALFTGPSAGTAPDTLGTTYPIYDANNNIIGYRTEPTNANWFEDTIKENL